ncbi:hypothetical protein HF086_010812 [Spodoptera exigua]|uniref:BMERB domain-containing protein n=1 Tax=Spodoptera exigua TaxID=7107 RepID=A0A922SCN1_SPOEX|nr:hypothetical protein HF086_010812 [Spodoptera exigua]
MASVWKRLQRVNKRAAKFQYTASYHRVDLETSPKCDEDMQSLASLLSVNNNSDIAVLEDLDEDDYTLSDNSTRQMLDLRQQMEEMTQSLTNSDIVATPNSVQSLNFDNSRTPTAPITPEHTTPTTPVPSDPTPNDNDVTNDPIPKTRPEMLSNLTKMVMKPEPKYFSTPKANNVINNEPKSEIKGVVFKPKTVAMRNLKPLELKTNLNSITLDRNENEKDEDSDKTPRPLTWRSCSRGNLIRIKRRSQESQESRASVERSTPEQPSPGARKDVRDLLHQSKAILGKVLSPARDHKPSAKWFADPLKVNEQLLSRHDELKERARQLLEATKREAREKDRKLRQKEKEEKENGHRNGDVSPKKGKESGSYIQSELEALEREQGAIDERAAALEKQLRRVMESADNTEKINVHSLV